MQITILALVRLANLADAIRMDSMVTRNVKEVVVVVGAVRVPKLVSPVAEPNAGMDHHAADITFTSSWKVIVLTENTVFKKIKNSYTKDGACF